MGGAVVEEREGGKKAGATERVRTVDLLFTKQLLYH